MVRPQRRVTAVPADHEVYFAIADSTRFRAPTITITHHGGVDIEELGKDQIANVPFEALTGLKAFVIANALADFGITDAFVLTGGGSMHLNDAFGLHPGLRCLFLHHEQASAIAAESYGRLLGRPALVNVTTGPGGVNALLADGHVQFIKDSINVATWRALGSRNGGEVVGADAF